MFQPNSKQIVVRGQQIVIRELSAGQVQALGDSIEELVAESIVEPAVTLDVVREWPGQVVLEIARECNVMNGFSEGNDSTPPG